MIDRGLVLPNLIRSRAEKDPDGVALQEAGGEAVTWQRYDEGNRRWAAMLRSMGVQPGDYVASMLPNSTVGINVWLGTSLAGAVEVPLNPVFQGALFERLIHVSQAKILVITADALAAHAEDLSGLTQLETIVVLGDPRSAPEIGRDLIFADQIADVDPPDDLHTPECWDLASVVFTSGTSGGSKGVLLPWGHFYASSQAYSVLGQAGRGFYSPYPLFHYGGRLMVYVGAVGGSTLVTRPQFSTSDFWTDVREYDVATAAMLGVWINFLLNEPETEGENDSPLELISMAPVVERYEEFIRRFDVRVFGGFGSTEIGTLFTTLECGDKITSNGKPMETIAGAEYRLVDQWDQPVAQGEIGELISRHSEPWTVMLGYLGDPEATVAAWRNGWFHTGDSFYQDEDGVYYFVDRTKDVIRRRGENISSLELEALVLQHPEITEAAAIGVPSEVGEEDVFLFVVLGPDAALTPEDVCADLDARLPKFMRPRHIEITIDLPKTPATMRVRKAELRARGRSPDTWSRS